MSTARISGHFLLVLVAVALVGACEKKPTTDTGAITAADRATGPVDTTPLPGIDATRLDGGRQKLFYTLAGSLGSPCGEAHSLRKSVTEDQKCKRAPFAARYVLALVEDEATEEQIRKEYASKYEAKDKPVQLDVSKAPRTGNDDTPVRLVEFYDYGCQGCARYKPILDKVAEENGDKATIYYMMFPLGRWVDSKSAGQAALAAWEQGKFKEMHAMLFERGQHNRDAVMSYAKEIGLDLDKFTADYEAAGPRVDADRIQGEKAGVETTPTIFLNERRYTGPDAPKYIKLWIEEEAAVNR